jgi:hypothetical protein
LHKVVYERWSTAANDEEEDCLKVNQKLNWREGSYKEDEKSKSYFVASASHRLPISNLDHCKSDKISSIIGNPIDSNR